MGSVDTSEMEGTDLVTVPMYPPPFQDHGHQVCRE